MKPWMWFALGFVVANIVVAFFTAKAADKGSA